MSKNLRNVKHLSRRKHSHILVKRTNARLAHWLKNALLVGCFLAVIGALTFFTIASVSAQAAPTLSAAKQQLVQSQAQWHAIVDKKKAPKGTGAASSCPVDLQHAPVITVLTPQQMVTMHNAYASFANVISAEKKPYFIFGENGRFVVQALSPDPCKTGLSQQEKSKQTFQNPTLHQGNLIILSVQGDLITYRVDSGATGTFDYVTGQFQ